MLPRKGLACDTNYFQNTILLLVLTKCMIKLSKLHSALVPQNFKTWLKTRQPFVSGPKGPGQVESRVKYRTWTVSVWSGQKESLDMYHTSCDTKGSHNKQSLPSFITSLTSANQFLLSSPEYILSVARNVKFFCGKQNYLGFFYFPTHQY